MSPMLTLASSSQIRSQLLTQAGVTHDVVPARIDEGTMLHGLQAEDLPPRDIADALAEAKAQKISAKRPDNLVLGCDQVLASGTQLLQKPQSAQDAVDQLTHLSGKPHTLYSAAVLYKDAQPQWRHVGIVMLQMRQVSQPYIEAYVERNWHSIRHAVGCYKLEEEGVRLFHSIQGDYFTVLGLPLLPLLGHLTTLGILDG